MAAVALKRNLRLATPEPHGPDVLTLQHQLNLHGAAIAEDGIYGPGTASAVLTVKRQLHYAPAKLNRIAGPAFYKRLVAAHPVPVPTGPNPFELEVLTEALKHVGVTEKPAGSNHQPFGVWFGENGVPWCNIFVSYCFNVGAGYTICHGYDAPGTNPKGCAYVPTTEAWLRMTDQWLGRTQPHDADISIYNFDGGMPDHIGITITAPTLLKLAPKLHAQTIAQYGTPKAGQFLAIEGNTSASSNANGGQVEIRLRTLSQVDGFGRIAA